MFNYNTSSLDTCVAIRLITRDDEKLYKRALKLVSDSAQTFRIEDVTIVEIVHVLETSNYSWSREDIIKSLETLFLIKNISYAPNSAPVFEKTYPLYLKYPMLSFNDCYLAVKSEAASAEPLWTFDKLLAKKLPSAKEII